jgi:hypothetical protein
MLVSRRPFPYLVGRKHKKTGKAGVAFPVLGESMKRVEEVRNGSAGQTPSYAVS